MYSKPFSQRLSRHALAQWSAPLAQRKNNNTPLTAESDGEVKIWCHSRLRHLLADGQTLAGHPPATPGWLSTLAT